jgi:hypothetical protein
LLRRFQPLLAGCCARKHIKIRDPAHIKLAGSLSLAVSLPTMLVGFARYSRDQSISVLCQNWGSSVKVWRYK